MSDKTYVVWSSASEDPAREQLSRAHATIKAHPGLDVVRLTGDEQTPVRMLVAGNESTLREALAPLGPAIQVEENLQTKPL